jgi:hypothetical protein
MGKWPLGRRKKTPQAPGREEQNPDPTRTRQEDYEIFSVGGNSMEWMVGHITRLEVSRFRGLIGLILFIADMQREREEGE